MKLFIAFPKYFFECKMSFVRRHVILKLLQLLGDNAVLSGQGWPDYDESATLKHNIDRLLPGANAVFWYKPLGGKNVPALKECDRTGLVTACSFNECWWPDQRALKECAESGTTLAICHHQNDLARLMV